MRDILEVVGKSIKTQTEEMSDGGNFQKSVGTIINAVLGVIAVVAVVFIILGGVNYTLSQGDPGKTKKARDTILYAVIGLIVTVLAFAIINFVLGVMKAN